MHTHSHTDTHTHPCTWIHMCVYSVCICTCTYIMGIPYAEAALQRSSHENVPGKIPPNSQGNTHAEVRPQQSHRAALLKSHSKQISHPP